MSPGPQCAMITYTHTVSQSENNTCYVAGDKKKVKRRNNRRNNCLKRYVIFDAGQTIKTIAATKWKINPNKADVGETKALTCII